MIFPVIMGKLVAGITAVMVAYLFFRKMYPAYVEGPEQGSPEAVAAPEPSTETVTATAGAVEVAKPSIEPAQ